MLHNDLPSVSVASLCQEHRIRSFGSSSTIGLSIALNRESALPVTPIAEVRGDRHESRPASHTRSVAGDRRDRPAVQFSELVDLRASLRTTQPSRARR